MRQENIINIIRQIKQGQKNALSELIKDTIGLAMTIVNNILFDPNDIEDAIQEIYIRVWQKIESYNPNKGQFSTWFYKIVQNECVDRNRKYKKLVQIPLSDNLIEQSQPIDEQIHNKYLKNKVITIALSLPTKQREVFVMRDIQNMTIEEVHKATGLSAGSVKTNLYHARKRIKELIEKEGWKL